MSDSKTNKDWRKVFLFNTKTHIAKKRLIEFEFARHHKTFLI